jgi:hypothetical protein
VMEMFLDYLKLKYYCIIHQEALCEKTSNLKRITDVVRKFVNKIRGRSSTEQKRVQAVSEYRARGELLLQCDVMR